MTFPADYIDIWEMSDDFQVVSNDGYLQCSLVGIDMYMRIYTGINRERVEKTKIR